VAAAGRGLVQAVDVKAGGEHGPDAQHLQKIDFTKLHFCHIFLDKFSFSDF
jgi:hypothetical protein